MAIDIKKNLIKTALGKKKADVVIKNGMVINVFSKEIIEADIAISNGMVVGMGEYNGVKEIDASGKYICPGLIDGHVHIESSLLTPLEFSKVILPYGTTTIIADPHEIANVCGINGIIYMLKQTENIPINTFYMIPSCVPSMKMKNNGADIGIDEIKTLLANERIVGLGEVMDYSLVLSGDNEMLEKMELFESSVIDGHSPGLTGKNLAAYRVSGAVTDHECSTIDEVVERIRLGMYVLIREGSAARNLEDIIKGLRQKNLGFDRCVFCTDDKHLEDINKEGHIIHNIRKAIGLGVDPIDAIRMATLNPAQCYNLRKIGAIAPGYYADLIILNSLVRFDVHSVLFRGEEIDLKKGFDQGEKTQRDPKVLDTVHICDVSTENLSIKIDDDMVNVIKIIPGQILTKKAKMQVAKEDGVFIADGEFSKLAVVQRHKANKQIGLGIIEGFCIEHGAIGSTVGHDSHNLIVIGDNDDDMVLAIEELQRVHGGFTVVSDGQIIDTFELPIAGLMSDKDADSVETDFKQVHNSALQLCVNKTIDPISLLSFLSLPVIPEIRLLDTGLFDVNQFKLIDINS